MSKYTYKKSSLDEFAIQLNFSKILVLNTTVPADFQWLIRDKYSEYHCVFQNQQTLIANSNAVLASVIPEQINKVHEFATSDAKSKITLSSDFIALSTVRYESWDNIKNEFMKVVDAFEKVYKVQYYIGAAIRYKNAFRKSKWNLKGTSWNELIEPMWLGAMTITDEKSILSTGINIDYTLNDKTYRNRVNSVIATTQDNVEKVLLFFSDFIQIKKVHRSDIDSIMSSLHNNAIDLYQSMITKKLHLAMEPEEV